MPYPTLDSLPDWVKEMPKHAQEIYQAAWNSAYEQYKDEGKAAATAITAVKTKYEKKEDKWVAKESLKEEDRSMDDKQHILQSALDKANLPIESLRKTYSELIQEHSRHNAGADAARIKKIIGICQEVLSSEEPDEAKAKETLKEADAILIWLKEQQVMKTEDGVQFPADAYAYTPSDNVSEWKLRLWEDPEKKITRKQLGAAAAALSPGGFRGQRVDIPRDDLPAVKRKIRAAYRSLDVTDEEMPRWVKESETRFLFGNFQPLVEAQVSAKGIAHIVVIKPGWGNPVDNHYYSEEMLRQNYKVFEGVKMYADHQTESEEKQRPEGSVKEWVASLKNVQYQDGVGVVGDAIIIEPWMQAKLANLRDKELLGEMGISIRAAGAGVKGKVDGREGNVIERITRVRSVDFVTEAGAGGMVTMYESVASDYDVDVISLEILKERRPDLVKMIETGVKAAIMQEVNKKMELEERVKELEGQVTTLTAERDEARTKLTEAEKAQRKAEAKSKIDEAISKSELPEAAKMRLSERFKDAESAEGVAEAIKSEQDYVLALKEAGKVKGMGGTQPDAEQSKTSLKESFKRLHPEYTEAQLETAINRR